MAEGDTQARPPQPANGDQHPSGDQTRRPSPRSRPRSRPAGPPIGGAAAASQPATSADDLLIGLGNSLRGDDGLGAWLAAWAQSRWPRLRVRSVQQLTPELSWELSLARRVLFVDAWWGAQARGAQGPCSEPIAVRRARPVPGWPCVRRRAPVLLPLRGAAGEAGRGEAGAFSHRLEPAQLLAITTLLHDRAPQAWMLLVPGFRFGHGEGLSSELQALLPEAMALLQRWCDQVGELEGVVADPLDRLRQQTHHA